MQKISQIIGACAFYRKIARVPKRSMPTSEFFMKNDLVEPFRQHSHRSTRHEAPKATVS
jgi:hypothetical protein